MMRLEHIKKIEGRGCKWEWTIQRHGQHWTQGRTKTYKIKTQHRKLKR